MIIFRTISWGHFTGFIFVLLVVYYLVWFAVFKAKKLMGRKKIVTDNQVFTAIATDNAAPEVKVAQAAHPVEVLQDEPSEMRDDSRDPDLYPVANELVEAIDEFLVPAGKKGMIKEEVLFGIRRLIEQYPMLKMTGFKIAVNNYISIALKNNCSFLFDEHEVSDLWK